MTPGRELLEMDQSHDLNHETHHGQLPPTSKPNNDDCNIYNPTSRFSKNCIFHVKQGSRPVMVKSTQGGRGGGAAA